MMNYANTSRVTPTRCQHTAAAGRTAQCGPCWGTLPSTPNCTPKLAPNWTWAPLDCLAGHGMHLFHVKPLAIPSVTVYPLSAGEKQGRV